MGHPWSGSIQEVVSYKLFAEYNLSSVFGNTALGFMDKIDRFGSHL